MIAAVAREALTNVVRHADAAPTRVDLRKRRDALVLTVADAGRGRRRDARGPATVRTHLGRAMLKLGARDREVVAGLRPRVRGSA